MSFDIVLMRSNSEKNRLIKDTETIMTVSGFLREGTSIIDPVIKIECDISDVVGCNYLSIPIFGRKYFVNDIRSIRNRLFEFSCHVDVLSTYADAIRENTGIIKRQENEWNLYLNDGTFKVYQNPNVLTRAFPSGFTTQEFVLAVAGS